MNKSRIKELENIIRYNAELYYSGMPIISDNEFDLLVAELKELDPNNPILKATGWGIKVSDDRKQPHKYGKVLGIEDKIKPADFTKKLRNLGCSSHKLYITPKLDGASVLLYYENGILKEALTRGDGDFGERCLDKVLPLVPNRIDSRFTGRIRGEFIISKENWNKFYAETGKSSRNSGSGLLLRKTDFEKDIVNYDIVCYTVLFANWNNWYDEYDDPYNFLRINGFKTVSVLEILGTDVSLNSNEECEKLLYNLNHNIYECDGLVVEVDGNQLAIKWNGDGKETTVKDIKWQSSRLGKLSPVVIFDPVELSGATITKASGFNYQFIKDTGLGIGSKISIIRAGDVIPYIDSVNTTSSEQNIPEYCPFCNTKLDIDGVNLVCKNIDCPSRGEGTLLYFINTVSPVDGLGEKILVKFFDRFKLTNVEKFIKFANSYSQIDLLRFCNETDGLGKSAFTKIITLLNKFRNEALNLDKLIIGLGLPALGEKSVRTVLDAYGYNDLIKKLKNKEIQSIAGVNYLVIQSLYTYNEYIETIINLLRNIPFRNLKKANKSDIIYTGMKICITGSLSVSRKSFLDEAKEYGIEEATIAKADVLITNDPDSGSSKNKEAQKRGIRVMSEKEFRNEFFI